DVGRGRQHDPRQGEHQDRRRQESHGNQRHHEGRCRPRYVPSHGTDRRRESNPGPSRNQAQAGRNEVVTHTSDYQPKPSGSFIMFKTLLLSATIAVVWLLSTPRELNAYGARHIGYTHVGPSGVYHAGRTVGYGPGGAFATGHTGAYGYGGNYYRGGYGAGV